MPGPPDLPALPIVELLPELRAALARHGRAVLTAPPGAGKSTVVPLALLGEPWIPAGGRIVMLEPRRLATRAIARRTAELAGDRVGGVVGYQTRDERRIGPATRIEVLTEGVLTRRLQRDPTLSGVAAVLFDEVHERNLTTDLGLALTLDAAALRPDLRIVAMSATADADRFAALLGGGDPAPVVTGGGRAHPVEVRWLPRRRDDRLEAATAAAVTRALAAEHGDVLVFLPGIGEITRAAAQVRAAVGDDVDVHLLAGALPTDEQDRALLAAPPGRRRVVLATDIAETSLTVEGVRVVVDSGLARAPRFDAGTGMTRLTTVAISRDSADQRAGRAGRLGPGVVYRLWSRVEHGARPAHRVAEITQVDLAGLVLELAAWGGADVPLLDPPPPRARRQAVDLLSALGALDASGVITARGRRMAELPLHPRLARMVVDRPDSLSCVVAALVDERDVLRGRPDELPSDLAMRVRLVAGRSSDDRADRRAVARVADHAADLARRAGIAFDLGAIDPDAAGAALLLAYPDRLAARRRAGQFQLRTGTGAWVGPDDPLAATPFVVAADLDGRRSGARIRRAAAVDADEIPALVDGVIEDRRLEWDDATGDLVERVERRLDGLRLGDRRERPAAGEATTAALVARVRATRLAALPWSPATTQLRARVGFLRDVIGEPWPDLGDAALVSRLEDWLAPHLVGASGRADLERLDLAVLLRVHLPWPLGAELEDLAPATWRVPGGADVAIDYIVDPPTAAVRVQDVFGMRDHPRLAGGRVPLRLSLLSPADRPLQVTADLPGFWAGSWRDVRKDLAGRYPKHRWPEDPAAAEPGRLRRPPDGR